MKRAVVLLSGGLDSATCLAMAQAAGYECHTLAFDYGQRHRTELEAAARVSVSLGASSHRVVGISLDTIGGSSLTDTSMAVPEQEGEGVPTTYVPARNTVFLSLGLGLAEVLAAQAIYIGINAVDYSGYPDCRPAFLTAFQTLADVATVAGVEGHGPRIEAPLLSMSKAEIVTAGTQLGVDYGATISCYQADEDGRACGRCDSCRLRRAGFEAAGLADPTRYV
ncbi:7-cyano-7-deazaguanine synthase QueC [Isoalcanivorax beigongshangi]|uniref:7-cyano-7-deazaguanine synthase n=1 Tax=Isoalcanivorax beigongshangi TaxID=3238810 RepID=A0ABV4AIP5_9GAMM